MRNEFSQKVVLITGSSRGIGKAIALEFAKKGAYVVINGIRNQEALEETLRELKKYSEECSSFLCDVSQAEGVKKLMDFVLKKYGKIDILVNNAGISYYNLLTDTTIEDWNKVIHTNLSSAYLCSKYALQNMVQNKNGVIINVSSIWGNYGSSFEVAYSASKGGVNSFTKALAKEAAPSNIRINAIAPGLTNTDMGGEMNSEEMIAFLKEHSFMGQLIEPEEIAHLVLFLSSDQASYITGQVVEISGGYM